MSKIELDRERLALNIEKRVNDDLKNCRIGGCSLAVCQHGELIYSGNFGYMNVAEQIPMHSRTLFRLASNTKPVSAAAAMIQVAAGKLCLDDKLSDYIPEYKHLNIGRMENGKPVLDRPAVTPVTLRHLLTHTSGIGSGDVGIYYHTTIPNNEYPTVKSYTKAFSEIFIDFEPGTRQSYSPLIGLDLVTLLVEITSGMDFYEFCKKNIFEPCDMPNTVFEPSEEQWGRMTEMHVRTPDGRDSANHDMDRRIFGAFPLTYHSGGASLVSSVPDYMHFTEMLRTFGLYKGRRVIPEAAVRQLGSPAVSKEIMPGSQQWGLGVRVITGENRIPVGSFGWSGAFGTHAWCDPANEISAVYMKNSEYDGGAGAVTANNFEEDVYASAAKAE